MQFALQNMVCCIGILVTILKQGFDFAVVKFDLLDKSGEFLAECRIQIGHFLREEAPPVEVVIGKFTKNLVELSLRQDILPFVLVGLIASRLSTNTRVRGAVS